MRIGLADQQIVPELVPPAALIAGNDARRNPCSAHQNHKRRTEVLAESGAGLEKEVIDRIAPKQWAATGCR